MTVPLAHNFKPVDRNFPVRWMVISWGKYANGQRTSWFTDESGVLTVTAEFQKAYLTREAAENAAFLALTKNPELNGTLTVEEVNVIGKRIE